LITILVLPDSVHHINFDSYGTSSNKNRISSAL